ncbi:MAG: hypothetical protein IRY97_12400, partial [Thermomicrobiaceae bacterium]|nr:hypothetical protein [Thermomicrobiaceae bacterium]
MPFTMALEGDAYHAAADCDHCGRPVPAGGFVLWRLDADAPLLVACGDDCFEALWAERAGAGHWAGAALDAYLARLVQR